MVESIRSARHEVRVRDAESIRLELIRARLAASGLPTAESGVDAATFPALPLTGGHPLSSAQQRMWFAQQRDPGSAAYNICAGFRIRGHVDHGLLAAAFDAVVAEQDVLRTVYRAGPDGLPLQEAGPSAEARLDVVELGHPVEDLAGAVDALVRRYGAEPFDLTRDCPLRLLLVVVRPGEQVLVLIAHHIAIDDLSWKPLLGAVAAHYRAGLTGEPAAVPKPRVRFAEFAAWERDRIDSGRFAGSLRHWRRALTPWPDPVRLPATGEPGAPAGTGLRRRVTLPVRMTQELTAFADRTRATLFMVGLACLQAVLLRYAPVTELGIGTVVINRDRPELGDLVGNFGNTVVLRTSPGENPRFVELLAEARRVCLGAFDHQEIPFDRVVEDLRPHRGQDGAGLFNVMFTQRGRILHGVTFPGQEWTEFPVFNGTTRFDLAVELIAAPDGLVLTATGTRSAFGAEDLDRLLGHLRTVLQGVLADPTRRISELPLLPDAEYTQIVHDWNATDRPEYLPHTTLAGLVAARVARSPNAVAVISGEGSMSYAELDARANRLARHLAARGVGRRDLVGVLARRSLELIVALLAVLKAGAAFVALDPAWPPLRTAELIGAAGLAAVLTDGGTDLEPGPEAAGVSVVNLVAEAAEIAARDSGAPDTPADLDDIAYVIYTSGSTGVPKGVMITHRGIVNRLPWQVDLLGLSESDAVLHKAPMSFDISVNEIFLPLVAGARLVLADPGGEGDLNHLISVITRHRVTFVYLVSSLLDLMVDRPDAAAAFASLRHVWCGGEVLTPELYERFRRRSTARMYHGYGPAEATIGVTCRVLEGTEHVGDMTIGRPNPNTRIYLLDPYRNPVPVGVAGELHIGGLPLARGYLNDPELTTQRFIADPFGDGRLYRTGDLARYRADGQIEFVGRSDNQVKIAGRRIEPEEIEAKLAAHPQVRQAVVLVRRDDRRGDVLIGHVAVGAGAITGAELSAWLAQRVPAYLVPAAILTTTELPVKPSGKVDRDALAAVALPAFERQATPFAAPRGALQSAIADIWRQLLDVDQLGIDDNFFDRGGHSLLVLRVQAEIRRQLDRDISVVALFDHPTIRTVAEYLGADATTVDNEELHELRRIRHRAGRQRRARIDRRPDPDPGGTP